MDSIEQRPMTREEAAELIVGQKVVTLVECIGEDPNGIERSFSIGTIAEIVDIERRPAPIGLAVTLRLGDDENESIVAVFDESDDLGYEFRPQIEGRIVRPDMASAGAELMAMSFRMEKHPDLVEDSVRIRKISGWATVGRQSDFERGAMRIMGGMFGVMREHGYDFHEDRPIVEQFEELLASIPEPVVGDADYVDPATIVPSARTHPFDALVSIGEVRRWSDAQGIPHAYADACRIEPDGVHGTCPVHATGFLCDLMVPGSTTTLQLRSTGGTLKVLRRGDMRRPVPPRPKRDDVRHASSLLRAAPLDEDVARILSHGMRLALADAAFLRTLPHKATVSAHETYAALERTLP